MNSIKENVILQTLLIILLLEGFITISVEILTMRQLTPFFGTSVLITSIIIGIFLLFLALGYWRGGIYRSNIFQRLSRNFSLALIWIGLGLTYSLVSLYFYFSIIWLGNSFLLSLFLYLLLVLAPIVYWLGQTIPLTTNLFNQELRVSDISGRALFISTLGSFLGAILTSLLLFQYLGVAWTVVINCAILFALILYIRPYSKSSWLSIAGLLLILGFIKTLNVNMEKLQFVATNNYANYAVIEQKNSTRILNINDSNSSLINRNNKGFPYVEYIRDLLFNKLNIQHQQILVIGAGGFTLTAKGAHGNNVTYVDIDPEIKNIAESSFLHAPIHGHFVGQDARAYLNQNKTQFDVIIADVYSNQSAIPSSLITVDYFQEIANHLKSSGLLIINTIDHPLFSDDYAQTTFNTIHAVFPYCTIVPVDWRHTSDLVNMIYMCPKLTKNKSVYSDNLNTSTIDFFKSRSL